MQSVCGSSAFVWGRNHNDRQLADEYTPDVVALWVPLAAAA